MSKLNCNGLSDLSLLADRAILIRKGGTESPLFVTHSGDGDLLYLTALTPHIDSNIPLYGLPAELKHTPRLRTVEGMAARMIQMIRAAQANGPYRLAGWSFGGLLAYEIAAQLIGADQQITFLGLINTYYLAGKNYLPDRYGFDLNDNDLLLFRIETERRLDGQLETSFDEIKCSAHMVDFPTLVQQCRERSLMPEPFMSQTAEQIQKAISHSSRYELASTLYCAQPIPIGVHLFANHDSQDLNPLLGWNGVMPESLLLRTHVEGPPQSIMSTPNVKALGQSLSRAIRKTEPGRTGLAETSYFPLVPLQEGRQGLAPLFCVPGAGASVTSFIELVGHLSRGWRIYGLEPRGLDGMLVPYATVEVAAESYLHAIDYVYPEGPVHLLGHSHGGWVVFEMGRRLFEMGRRIAALTILDTEAPDADDAIVREYNSLEAIMEWIDAIELILERPLGIRQSDLQPRSESERRKLLHNRLVNERLMPRSSKPDVLRGPLRNFSMSLRSHYRPARVYTGPAQLILVDDPKLDYDDNQQWRQQVTERWKQWAPNLFGTHIAGNHATLLKSPHVHCLARLVQDNARS
jgi:thioesterase domain-containing protein